MNTIKIGFPLRTSASPPTLYPSSLQLPLFLLSLCASKPIERKNVSLLGQTSSYSQVSTLPGRYAGGASPRVLVPPPMWDAAGDDAGSSCPSTRVMDVVARGMNRRCPSRSSESLRDRAVRTRNAPSCLPCAGTWVGCGCKGGRDCAGPKSWSLLVDWCCGSRCCTSVNKGCPGARGCTALPSSTP
jgi:hypothetical protein